jgi:putative peptidoglycan lipid II flippase
VRLLVATGVMAATLLLLSPPLELWQQWNWWDRSLQLGLLVIAGLVVYVGSQMIMGTRMSDFYTQKPS